MCVSNESFNSIQNRYEIFSDSVCNQLADKAASLLKKYTGADLLIICGDGGVGNSSLIKSITSEDVYVTSTLESSTSTTALVPTVINGKRCLLFDMPGLNIRDFDDWDIFFRPMTAMSVVQSYVEFRGVLYVDSFVGNRITPAAEKTRTWLSLFCGLDYMPNFTIVTTQWDRLNEDGIMEKLSCLDKWKDGLLKPLISNGATFYHHGLSKRDDTYETLHIDREVERRRMLARRHIATHYQDPTSLKLQIYVEIANGTTIDTTLAGRWLKYGITPDSTQSSGESGPSNKTYSHDGGQPSSSGFWTTFTWQDAKPWVELMLKATRVYMSSAPKGGSFSDFDSMSESQSWFEGPPFVDDEGEFPDISIPEPGTSQSCAIL